MEKVIRNFPFWKLKLEHIVIPEILLHIKHFNALEFLFTTNRQSRQFLKQNFSILKNAFENEGL
jgi:hypothetical protein